MSVQNLLEGQTRHCRYVFFEGKETRVENGEELCVIFYSFLTCLYLQLALCTYTVNINPKESNGNHQRFPYGKTRNTQTLKMNLYM